MDEYAATMPLHAFPHTRIRAAAVAATERPGCNATLQRGA